MLNDPARHAREAALATAIDLHRAIIGDLRLERGVDRAATFATAHDEIRATAETFAAWLQGTTRIALTRGPITIQHTGVTRPAPDKETPMQIHDDEQFTLSVDTKDAKGFETSDQIDWSVDDDTVVTLDVSEDGRSCTVVAGQPGSAVITVTDNAVDPALSATEAVDVVPGGTATITLTEGPVSKQ